MKLHFLLWTLLVALAAGCGSSDSSSSDSLDADQACSNLVTYCPSGYSWSAYVSDEAGCRTTLDCVYQFYSGDCRQIIADSASCLANITSEAGCTECSNMFAATALSCDYPSGCL